MGQRQGFSSSDLAKLNAMYGCKVSAPVNPSGPNAGGSPYFPPSGPSPFNPYYPPAGGFGPMLPYGPYPAVAGYGPGFGYYPHDTDTSEHEVAERL
uniref:Peptidase M12A domain-containing protein n=1 Tax=Anopheles coluzzii TaxID=1518534 RepID=A0A8W7Q1J6_ANOCL